MSERTRLYKVAYGDKTRLVEAPSAAAAMQHVASEFFKTSVATPKEIATAMKSGIELESVEPKKASKAEPAVGITAQA